MLKKRLRYYLITYILGYIVSISSTGVPELVYLIPFKVVAIVVMLVAGNGIYFIAEEGELISGASFRTIKYTVFSGILLLVFALLTTLLNDYGIDITPIIGIE